MVKISHVILSAMGCLATASCSTFPGMTSSDTTPQVPPVLITSVIGATGQSIGTATFRDGSNGMLLRLELNAGALSPGWHGLHLHMIGDCSDTGVFKASGGHVGKVDGGHGLLNPIGPEAGDIPNIWAATNGSAGYEAYTELTSLSDLLDADGSAIIIHANPDDHITQPIGGAGPRVGCAVLK